MADLTTIYDITDHPLLSAAAKALDPDVLKAQVQAAEGALGLESPAVTSSILLGYAQTAIARQVNFQVAGGTDAAIFNSQSRGGRSQSFRTSAHGSMISVDPIAQDLANRVNGSKGWATQTGVR